LLNIYDSFPDEEVEAHVENQAKSIKKKFKPYPLATITLQKLGTQKLRMSSDQVMDHAEKLYQKGILSYPRTETDSYPPTMNLRNLVAMFENAEG
jgi:DNA topoisomerase-3